MRIRALLVAATLLSSLPYAGALAQAAGQARVVRDATAGYHLTTPTDWPATPGRIPELKTVINTPGTTNPGSCTVAVHAAPEFEGLQQDQLDWSINNHPWFAEDWATTLADRFTDITVKDMTKTKMSNRPVHLATIVGTEIGAPNTRTVSMMFYSRAPGRIWHVACGASGPDERAAQAAFNARRIEFLRILSTFAWEQ